MILLGLAVRSGGIVASCIAASIGVASSVASTFLVNGNALIPTGNGGGVLRGSFPRAIALRDRAKPVSEDPRHSDGDSNLNWDRC